MLSVYKGSPCERRRCYGYRCGRPHTQRPPLCRGTLQDCSHYDGTFVEVEILERFIYFSDILNPCAKLLVPIAEKHIFLA